MGKAGVGGAPPTLEDPENQQARCFCWQQTLGSPETEGTAGFFPPLPVFAGFVSDFLGLSTNGPGLWLFLVGLALVSRLMSGVFVLGQGPIRCSEQKTRGT